MSVSRSRSSLPRRTAASAERESSDEQDHVRRGTRQEPSKDAVSPPPGCPDPPGGRPAGTPLLDTKTAGIRRSGSILAYAGLFRRWAAGADQFRGRCPGRVQPLLERGDLRFQPGRPTFPEDAFQFPGTLTERFGRNISCDTFQSMRLAVGILDQSVLQVLPHFLNRIRVSPDEYGKEFDEERSVAVESAQGVARIDVGDRIRIERQIELGLLRGALRSVDRLSPREMEPSGDRLQELTPVDGFGHVVVHTRLDAEFPVPVHGVRGHGNDGQAPKLLVFPDHAGWPRIRPSRASGHPSALHRKAIPAGP